MLLWRQKRQGLQHGSGVGPELCARPGRGKGQRAGMGEALGMGPKLPACPGLGGRGGLGLLCVAAPLPAPHCPDPRGASVLPSAAAGGREGGWSLLEKVTLCACSSLGCGCWSQGRLRAACVLLLTKGCGGGRQQPQHGGRSLREAGVRAGQGWGSCLVWGKGSYGSHGRGKPSSPSVWAYLRLFAVPRSGGQVPGGPRGPLRPPAPSPVSAARSLLAGRSRGHVRPGLAACSRCAYAAVAPV